MSRKARPVEAAAQDKPPHAMTTISVACALPSRVLMPTMLGVECEGFKFPLPRSEYKSNTAGLVDHRRPLCRVENTAVSLVL